MSMLKIAATALTALTLAIGVAGQAAAYDSSYGYKRGYDNHRSNSYGGYNGCRSVDRYDRYGNYLGTAKKCHRQYRSHNNSYRNSGNSYRGYGSNY